MKEMMSLADDERKVIGQFANELKSSIEVAFGEKERSMFQEEEMHRAEDEWMDITERKIFVSGTFTSRDASDRRNSKTFENIGFTASRIQKLIGTIMCLKRLICLMIISPR